MRCARVAKKFPRRRGSRPQLTTRDRVTAPGARAADPVAAGPIPWICAAMGNMRRCPTRRFVESQLGRWRGARALYREGAGIPLVELDNRIATDRRGLRATCVLVPTPGLAIRSAEWSISLSWEASSFAQDRWHSPYVPMTVRFDRP